MVLPIALPAAPEAMLDVAVALSLVVALAEVDALGVAVVIDVTFTGAREDDDTTVTGAAALVLETVALATVLATVRTDVKVVTTCVVTVLRLLLLEPVEVAVVLLELAAPEETDEAGA